MATVKQIPDIWQFLSMNLFCDVMVSMLLLSVVDRGFELWLGQIGICCFSAKHASLKSKRKNWLAQNQDHVYEWGQHVYPRTVASV